MPLSTTEAALLAAIVESSDDAIISTDLTGTIVTWNKGAERTFGYSSAEAVGQPFTILIPTESFEQESVILKEVLKGKPVEHYETVRQRKDRSLIDISLTISPLKDETGKIAVDYGTWGIPESFFIDPQGRITYKHVGSIRAALVLTKLEEAAKSIASAQEGKGDYSPIK